MGNLQEVFGVNKSWFYLTLWHGTPPEFTNEFIVDINNVNTFSTDIQSKDETYTSIETVSLLSANLKTIESINSEIITTTEVTWYVGHH